MKRKQGKAMLVKGRRALGVVLALLVSVLVTGCGGGSPSPTYGTIDGYISVPSDTSVKQLVAKSATAKGSIGVAGAMVTAAGPETRTATTDQYGYFALNLTPGVYQVTVTHPNYVGLRADAVTVPANQTVSLAWELGSYYYIIVGNSNYLDPGTPDLPACIADALRFRQAVTSGNIYANDVTELVLDGTKAQIRAAVDRVKAKVSYQDSIVLFYSGHGSYTPWAGVDETADDANDELICPVDGIDISDDELEQWFAAYPTQEITFVFDSCFSGGMVKSEKPKEVQIKDLDRPEYTVLMAADDHEISLVDPATGYSVFTEYVCAGIETRSADANRDGYLTATEIFNYAEPATIARSTFLGRVQNPQMYQGTQSLGLPLVRYR